MARSSTSIEDEDPVGQSTQDGDDGQNLRDQTNANTTNDSILASFFPSFSNWYASLNKGHALIVLILVFVNLINYMDRSTVAGMMNSIKNDPNFNLQNNNEYLGLLQTAFVFCYMIFAPLFGYLGDRYNRSWIMGFGLVFWCLSTLIGSFMKSFWWFLAFRAFVGIGEASYSTIAPAIISDLFKKDTRSQVLALFYFAIPVGTGLGYIVGSEVADQASDWRWGLRVTPFLGLVAIVAIIFFMEDPPRGESEGSHLRPAAPKDDLRALAKTKSFVLSTLAFTCVTFSAGALMWWGPQFAFLGAKASCGLKSDCDKITMSDISYKFGIVMTFSGLIGVPAGSYIAQAIRHKVPNADPIVSGVSLLASVPVLFFGFISARFSIAACYGLTFLAGLLLNCNWSVVSDMTLYIVIPTRRSLASATQILTSHMLGDAISPYLIGAISDSVNKAISPDHVIPDTPLYYDLQFRSLQYALFTSCFFQALGSLFFFITSFYVLEDKREADRQIAGEELRDDDEAAIIQHVD